MPRVTWASLAGSTLCTSPSGTQAVRTLVHAPSATVARVETACPVANSPTSRYCRSATRSSRSSSPKRRGSGRAMKPGSQRKVSRTWKA